MKRILIVDSDPRVCQAIHEALSGIRHNVFFAFDAVSAVSEVRKQNPDLVIVDLSLPAGGGISVVEHLRAQTAFLRTPIIVTAERGARLEAPRVYAAGANAFLYKKPISRQLLLQNAGRLLPKEPPQDTWRDTVQTVVK